jgi:3-dehydroquinate synthase
MNRVIRQNFQVQFQYQVLFSEGIFHPKNSLLVETLIPYHQLNIAKAVVVIDEGMYAHHPELMNDIRSYFHQYKDNIKLAGNPLLVTGGEAVKNDWKAVNQVIDLLNEQKIDRHSYVIAIGGGAVLDAVGFATTIAHRGVRLIRIPTTVLAQNDSGVGVKNAINYFDKKNFLGTFQPPFAVINDRSFLTTLSDRDWRSGISEAIKVALIKDPDFFNWIEENAHQLAQRDMDAMDTLIFRCAELHTEHISTNGDPFEQGSSRPLDFGHWAAHKLEYLTNYALTHGEAVAIGIVLDSCYSHKIGYLSEAELTRILQCFRDLGFELDHPLLFDPNNSERINPELIHGLEEFREHLGGVLTIMLLKAIGTGKEVHSIASDVLHQSTHYLNQLRHLITQ